MTATLTKPDAWLPEKLVAVQLIVKHFQFTQLINFNSLIEIDYYSALIANLSIIVCAF